MRNTRKRLPTIYHWSRAAYPWASSGIVPLSNFGGQGQRLWGATREWGVRHLDMAGNARE
jgi:hypothetical protein